MDSRKSLLAHIINPSTSCAWCGPKPQHIKKKTKEQTKTTASAYRIGMLRNTFLLFASAPRQRWRPIAATAGSARLRAVCMKRGISSTAKASPSSARLHYRLSNSPLFRRRDLPAIATRLHLHRSAPVAVESCGFARRGRKDDDDDESTEEYLRQAALEREKKQIAEAREQDAPQSRFGRILVGIPVLGALLGKTKYLMVGAQLFKFKSLASMMLSVGVYGMFFGLPYAAGMVGMLAVHEAGHALVMLQRGIPVGAMTFIPFVGASVQMKDNPPDAYEGALIAFGGPVIGGLAAGGVALAGVMTHSQLLLAIANFGFVINLMNLFPIMPDGAMIAGSISKHLLAAGLVSGTAIVVLLPVYNPLAYLILLGGGYVTYKRYRPGPDDEEQRGYYDIPNATKTGIAVAYFATIAALFAGWQYVRRRLMSPAQLKAAQESGELEKIEGTHGWSLDCDRVYHSSNLGLCRLTFVVLFLQYVDSSTCRGRIHQQRHRRLRRRHRGGLRDYLHGRHGRGRQGTSTIVRPEALGLHEAA